MANTPRSNSAYIILGVIDQGLQQKRILGIDVAIDDNDIQHHLKLWCDPIPQVSYYSIEYKGKWLGVIEIHRNTRGPFVVGSNISDAQDQILSEFGKFLIKDTIYFRRSSTNDFLRTGKDEEFVLNWFSDSQDDRWHNWSSFKAACHQFSPSRKYVLITGPLSTVKDESLKGLGNIDWTAVIDFDPTSDQTGLLAALSPSSRRNIIRVVKRDNLPPFNPETDLYWFFARGLVGREDTLVTASGKPLRSWLAAYNSEMIRQFEKLASSIAPELVTFVVLAYGNDQFELFQRTIEMTACFEDRADYVVVSNGLDSPLPNIAVDLTYYNILPQRLCDGLLVSYSSDGEESHLAHTLPSADGTPVPVESSRRHTLESSLELLYINHDLAGEGDEFFKGRVISWRELDLRKDADRDKTTSIERAITKALRQRDLARIQIYHKPGAGGTTVARRLLWDKHATYPCAVLKFIQASSIQVIADALAYISSITSQPILLLIDGATVADRLVDDLYNYVKSQNTPVTFVLTSRRSDSQRESGNAFQVELRLSHSEVPRFVDRFKSAVPQRAPQIHQLGQSKLDHERTAFIFGLTAYEHEFQGLQRYIQQRVATLSQVQRSVLVYLALAYYYAQRGIPAQAFSEILGLNGKEVRFDKVFDGSTSPVLDLLIREEHSWRIMHFLVAEEILHQLLLPTPESDPRTWTQQLSGWAKDFIAFCRGNSQLISDTMIELVRRAFVYRDNLDMLGRDVVDNNREQFARLILDIPAPEGRGEVFVKLTEEFPDEAHFWAHYARFLSSIKHYDAALRANQRAIELQPTDHILWHVQGMTYRHQVRNLIEQKAPITEVVGLAEKASENFAQNRLLGHDTVYGHISEVQLIVNVLNYAASLANGSIMDYLRRPGVPTYVREGFDRAENLLGQLTNIRDGHVPDEYEQNCRGDLQRLYGNTSKALEIWDNLLNRDDVYRPSIRRQIVYTILSQGDWSNISDRQSRRIADLLETNLAERPNSEQDLRLWLRAVRYIDNPPSIGSIIEKLSYWRTNTNALDAVYYLYVLNTLLALERLPLELESAIRLIEECRQLSRLHRNNHKSIEWYGPGEGIGRLVHTSLLGDWNESNNFWSNDTLLSRVTGVIVRVKGPQNGEIEIRRGLRAFFVPGASNISGNDVNRTVDFFLGFSYSGLRAWSVREKP